MDIEPLLEIIWQDGKLVYDLPSLEALRKQGQRDLERLDSGVRRLLNPHIHHVSLSPQLWQLKQALIANFKRQAVN